MINPSLSNDIRQLFAESVLIDFQRLEESEVKFTFNSGDIYLSVFFEAINHISVSGFLEHDPMLLYFAQVFERYVSRPVISVDPSTAATISAALFWLAGYSASAFVIANLVDIESENIGPIQKQLLSILSRKIIIQEERDEQNLYYEYHRYISTGDITVLQDCISKVGGYMDAALNDISNKDDFVFSLLLSHVLKRLENVGFWPSILEYSTASIDVWKKYISQQLSMDVPIIDLWPSQRSAIQMGLLDGKSSLIIRTPTSSGKTKMAELAFINDLSLSPDNKVLYLAPFRALVNEVENDIGHTLSQFGFNIASLYGGSETNELEIDLGNIARVTIATPEKIEAIHRRSDLSLSNYQLVILDEGDLLSSLSRGARFELQITRLKLSLKEAGRAIFISAVLPNSDEIASWLAGSPDYLVRTDWQPTTMRIGVVTWPSEQSGRLTYKIQTGQQVTDGFFVPRFFDEEIWQENNPETGFPRTIRFPERGNNGIIAASIAFKVVESGPVIIFANRPAWADSIAHRILERLSYDRPIDSNFVTASNQDALAELSEFIEYRLGEGNLLSKCIRNGFALHHGQIPQSIRLIIEEEYHKGTLKLLIATNTIAQGVNFPVKTIIVHSFPYTDAPVRDFWNLVGRAGRALKETFGEVLILATGSLSKGRLRKFLAQSNSERVDSVILNLVKQLIDNYQVVTSETIDALLTDCETNHNYDEILRDIDRQLLDLLAEDAQIEHEGELFNDFLNNLFASYQAEIDDLALGSNYKKGVDDLLRSRRNYVLSNAPDASDRARYARTGLSLDTLIAFDLGMSEFISALLLHPQITTESIDLVVNFISDAVELAGINMESLSSIIYTWIRGGSYTEVTQTFPDIFDDVEDFIKFVEREFNYRLPWVLDGLVQDAQEFFDGIEDPEGSLPEWFINSSGYIRYGIDSKELLWIMSLGINDRPYSEWLLSEIEKHLKRPPENFYENISVMSEIEDELISKTGQDWPAFYENKLKGIIGRNSLNLNRLNP